MKKKKTRYLLAHYISTPPKLWTARADQSGDEVEAKAGGIHHQWFCDRREANKAHEGALRDWPTEW